MGFFVCLAMKLVVFHGVSYRYASCYGHVNNSLKGSAHHLNCYSKKFLIVVLHEVLTGVDIG